MSSLPRRIDELAFFRNVVRRINVRHGSLLATGHRHVTLELTTEGLSQRQIGILLAATVACPACGSAMNPFRSRRGPKAERTPANVGRLFLSASCRLKDSIGCARGSAASSEIQRLVKVILAAQKLPPTTPPVARPAPPVKAAPSPESRGAVSQLGLRGLLA